MCFRGTEKKILGRRCMVIITVTIGTDVLRVLADIVPSFDHDVLRVCLTLLVDDGEVGVLAHAGSLYG